VAYDPCYSLVDVILLATLGVRALRRGDPGVRVLINRIIGTQYAHSSSACGNSQTPHCSTRPVPSSPSSLMQSSARTQLSTSSFSGATRSGAAAGRPTSVRFHFDPCATALIMRTTAAASYGCMHAPGYVTAYNGESPCGEDNCLQWIPRSRIEAFNRARGPASEPGVRQVSLCRS
jgi:hypothetical protein